MDNNVFIYDIISSMNKRSFRLIKDKATTLVNILIAANMVKIPLRNITHSKSKDGNDIWYISTKYPHKIGTLEESLQSKGFHTIRHKNFIAVSKSADSFVLRPYSNESGPPRQFWPMNDDFENNPDRDFISGPYSTFDPALLKLGRKAKLYKRAVEEHLAPKHNVAKDAGNDALAKRIKEEYDDRVVKIEKRVQSSLHINDKILTQIARTLRKDIMTVIVNNSNLREPALNFSRLDDDDEQITFGQELMDRLSLRYSHGIPGRFRLEPDVNPYYDTRTDTIVLNPELALDDFITDFAHEYGHRISYMNPNQSIHGAQQEYVERQNYITGAKKYPVEYACNVDEISSTKIEEIVGKDFEKDLKNKLKHKKLFQIKKSSSIEI